METVDGRSLTAQVDHPKGSITNPMTGDEMNAKVHCLADDVLGAVQVARLVEIVGRLDDVKDLRELTSVLIRRVR